MPKFVREWKIKDSLKIGYCESVHLAVRERVRSKPTLPTRFPLLITHSSKDGGQTRN